VDEPDGLEDALAAVAGHRSNRRPSMVESYSNPHWLDLRGTGLQPVQAMQKLNSRFEFNDNLVAQHLSHALKTRVTGEDGSMLPLFLREFRENAKWAAMIAGVFCAFIALHTWHTGPFFLFDIAQDVTLLYAPIAGLAMGVAQSWFETRPDNWSFLVHRPVPRTAIFLSKCAAGLSLLYASLALPCALAAAWAAHRGSVPLPFQVRMLNGLVAEVLGAGCYYFVGIVLTLRKASWFGTRILPLGLAFLCSLAVFLSLELWQALAFDLACIGISGVSAWGVFATGGAADRGSASRFCLGAMIFSGAATIACIAVTILASFESTTQWHELHMDLRGNVVHYTKTYRDGELTYQVTDLAGHPLSEYDSVDFNDPASADRFVRFTGALLDDRLIPWPGSAITGNSYRGARPGILSLRAVAPPKVQLNTISYFDVQERIIDLYDPSTNLMVGRIGPMGFTAGDAPPLERFPDEPLNGMLQSRTRTIAFPSCVYWMELDQQRVRKIFTASADDPVVCAHELPPQAEPSILVATRSRLHLLRASGESEFSIPLDVDLKRYAIQAGFLPDNRDLVLEASAISPGDVDAFPDQFLEYSANGNLQRRTQPPEPVDAASLAPTRTLLMGVVFPPAAVPLFHAWVLDQFFGLEIQHHRRLFIIGLLICLLSCGPITLFVCNRHALSKRRSVAWSLGNMLLGPAGIITFLGLHTRLEEQALARCGAVPSVATDGREIFEPADACAMALP